MDQCNILWIDDTSYGFFGGPINQRYFYDSIGALWINWKSFGSIEYPVESATPPI